MQTLRVACDQSLLLRAGPALQLGLAEAGGGEGGESLDMDYGGGRMPFRGRRTVAAEPVSDEARERIQRHSDVEAAGAKAKDIEPGWLRCHP